MHPTREVASPRHHVFPASAHAFPPRLGSQASPQGRCTAPPGGPRHLPPRQVLSPSWGSQASPPQAGPQPLLWVHSPWGAGLGKGILLGDRATLRSFCEASSPLSHPALPPIASCLSPPQEGKQEPVTSASRATGKVGSSSGRHNRPQVLPGKRERVRKLNPARKAQGPSGDPGDPGARRSWSDSRSDSWSGHRPRLRAHPQWGVREAADR